MVRGNDVKFDYSKDQTEGARLKTSGGRASGPQTLKNLHQFRRETIFRRTGQNYDFRPS